VNVILLQVFVSLVLVATGVVLFVFVVRAKTLEHSDRLSLAPLDDDARLAPPVTPPPVAPPPSNPS
jgi:hypothetical protein